MNRHIQMAEKLVGYYNNISLISPMGNHMPFKGAGKMLQSLYRPRTDTEPGLDLGKSSNLSMFDLATNLEQCIEAMQRAMVPIANHTVTPKQLHALVFNVSSCWEKMKTTGEQIIRKCKSDEQMQKSQSQLRAGSIMKNAQRIERQASNMDDFEGGRSRRSSSFSFSQAEIDELKQNDKQLKKESLYKERELEKAGEEISKLKRNLKECDAEIQSLKRIRRIEKELLESLEQQLKKSNQERQRLQEKCQRANNEIEQLKIQRRTIRARQSLQEDALETKRLQEGLKEVDKYKREAYSYRLKLEKLQSDFETAQSEAEQKTLQLLAENESLKSQFAEDREQFNQIRDKLKKDIIYLQKQNSAPPVQPISPKKPEENPEYAEAMTALKKQLANTKQQLSDMALKHSQLQQRQEYHHRQYERMKQHSKSQADDLQRLRTAERMRNEESARKQQDRLKMLEHEDQVLRKNSELEHPDPNLQKRLIEQLRRDRDELVLLHRNSRKELDDCYIEVHSLKDQLKELKDSLKSCAADHSEE